MFSSDYTSFTQKKNAHRVCMSCHGRRSRGGWGHVPPEFGVGDDNAIVPPQILS